MGWFIENDKLLVCIACRNIYLKLKASRFCDSWYCGVHTEGIGEHG